MKSLLSFLLLFFFLTSPLSLSAGERGITIKGKLEQESGKRMGAYRALIIGINDYEDKNIPDLATPVKDAQSVASLLKQSYGFGEITLLLDRQASGTNIMKTMRRLANSSEPEDSVLIYYAGHGDLDRLTKDGYWIPANATASDPFTYIANGSIQQLVKAIPARHVLLISDSCFSGTLFGTTRALPSIIDDRYYANLYKEKSRWGMTSGNLTPVSDSGSSGHSVFAYHLLKALAQNHKPYLTPREIYQDIAPVISNNSSQMPIANPLRNVDDQGGEFIFIRSDGSAESRTPVNQPTRVAGADQTTVEVTFWNSIKDGSDPAVFEAYLDEFPDGNFAALARIKLKQLASLSPKSVQESQEGAFLLSVPDITRGLVAYYPLDGNGEDMSGNGLSGKVKNAKIAKDRYGEKGKALTFIGRDSMVLVNYSQAFTPEKLTISLWVNGHPNGWARFVDTFRWNAEVGYTLYYNQDNDAPAWGFFDRNREFHDLSARTKFKRGKWVHLAVTYDGVTSVLYVDGRQENSLQLPQDSLVHSQRYFSIGNGFDDNLHWPFYGAVDEVRLYNRALSSEEIQMLYNAEKP